MGQIFTGRISKGAPLGTTLRLARFASGPRVNPRIRDPEPIRAPLTLVNPIAVLWPHRLGHEVCGAFHVRRRVRCDIAIRQTKALSGTLSRPRILGPHGRCRTNRWETNIRSCNLGQQFFGAHIGVYAHVTTERGGRVAAGKTVHTHDLKSFSDAVRLNIFPVRLDSHLPRQAWPCSDWV